MNRLILSSSFLLPSPLNYLLLVFALGGAFGLQAISADANDEVSKVVDATYKVANSGSTATAFLVSLPPSEITASDDQAILVTAAHVFEAMTGSNCKLIAREKRLDGTWLRKELEILIRRDDKPLWVRHAVADVAAMLVTLPPTICNQAIDLKDVSGGLQGDPETIALGDPVWVLGFPAQLESSRAGFPILRHGTVASFPLEPTKRRRTFMVDYTTYVGDSGGPVFRRSESGQVMIVGLVHGQHRETTKSTTANEERITHRSMGLAIVTHGQFIHETIQQLPQSDAATTQ